MTVAEIISQIKVLDGKVISISTNKKYSPSEFIDRIVKTCKLSAKQKHELQDYLANYERKQTEDSKHIEKLIDKYDFKFSDGVYMIHNEIYTMDKIYRLMWKEERLLPDSVDTIIGNVEKISEPLDLQQDMFNVIKSRRNSSKSKYLESLDSLYPKIDFRAILHNVLVPNTKPLFHLLYDDGVGGTGKSTLLDVIIKIVGESFCSNVILDQFGNRFIFANMLGKYVNVGDDNGKNDELQNIGTLKSIITGQRITIDRKNINPIEVKIFAKQLYATNIMPYVDFTDGGIMRRINIIPMNNVIPKDMQLCKFDDVEIGAIINESLESKDLEINNNEPAITTNPIYRFYNDVKYKKEYQNYKAFCSEYGFKQCNVTTFETRLRFIKAFCKNTVETLVESEEYLGF